MDNNSNLHQGAKPSTFRHANALRKRATPAERKLWTLLRNRKLVGAKFRRQHPLGGYILDFYCHEFKLAVELDGNHHRNEETSAYDDARTIALAELGITILRFWNSEMVKHPENVLQKIALWIKHASA